MKTNQDGLPATPQPVLPWHREAAICIMGLNYPPGDAVANIAHIIAVHHWAALDPHAETVRLLEELDAEIQGAMNNADPIDAPDILDGIRVKIRAHLAALKGTQ